MKQVVLVEGMDNTGKSTLVNKIVTVFQADEVEHSPGPQEPKDLLFSAWDLLKNAHWGDGLLILDRISLVSEEIYGPIIRGASYFTREAYEFLMELFLELKPIIIYARPPRDTIIGSILERDQMEGVVSNTTRLIDAYDLFFKNLSTTYPVHVYNYTEDPHYLGILNILESKIRR